MTAWVAWIRAVCRSGDGSLVFRLPASFLGPEKDATNPKKVAEAHVAVGALRDYVSRNGKPPHVDALPSVMRLVGVTLPQISQADDLLDVNEAAYRCSVEAAAAIYGHDIVALNGRLQKEHIRPEDLAAALSETAARLGKVAREAKLLREDEPTSLTELIGSLIDDLSKPRVETKWDKATLLFPSLDRFAKGCMTPDNEVVFYGRMGVGKTWVLLAIALANAMAGLNVAMLSGEMSSRQNTARLVTLLSKLPVTPMLTGAIGADAFEVLKSLRGAPLDNFRIRGFSGRFEMTDVEAMAAETSADLIIVDGAYMCRPHGIRWLRTPVEIAEARASQFKDLYASRGCVMVTSHQMNRDYEAEKRQYAAKAKAKKANKEGPEAEQVDEPLADNAMARGGDASNMYASATVFLEKSKARDEYWASLKKNRHGPGDQVMKYLFRPEDGLVEEISRDRFDNRSL